MASKAFLITRGTREGKNFANAAVDGTVFTYCSVPSNDYRSRISKGTSKATHLGGNGTFWPSSYKNLERWKIR